MSNSNDATDCLVDEYVRRATLAAVGDTKQHATIAKRLAQCAVRSMADFQEFQPEGGRAIHLQMLGQSLWLEPCGDGYKVEVTEYQEHRGEAGTWFEHTESDTHRAAWAILANIAQETDLLLDQREWTRIRLELNCAGLTSDHRLNLAPLTDCLVWALHGHPCSAEAIAKLREQSLAASLTTNNGGCELLDSNELTLLRGEEHGSILEYDDLYLWYSLTHPDVAGEDGEDWNNAAAAGIIDQVDGASLVVKNGSPHRFTFEIELRTGDKAKTCPFKAQKIMREVSFDFCRSLHRLME